MGSDQDDRPLFATQGGGYAVYENGKYVWHSEIPNFINAHVGDSIPKDWGVEPANEAAYREIAAELRAEDYTSRPGFWLTDEGYTPPGM